MRQILLILGFIFTASVAWSAAGFQCYTVPGTDIQTFEYASGNCGGVKSDKMLEDAGKDTIGEKAAAGVNGEKPILCVFQAGCKAVLSGPVTEPKHIIPSELLNMLLSKELKVSMRLCAHTGTYKDGKLVSHTCGTPTACNDGEFFNDGLYGHEAGRKSSINKTGEGELTPEPFTSTPGIK